jgi:hypothetical protein
LEGNEAEKWKWTLATLASLSLESEAEVFKPLPGVEPSGRMQEGSTARLLSLSPSGIWIEKPLKRLDVLLVDGTPR